MRVHRFCIVLIPVLMLASGAARAHEESEGKRVLGTVAFKNSCDAKVQKPLTDAIAMLHSFWWSEGEKIFRAVLAQDPACVIAAWGAASLLMSNPLTGQGASPKSAEQAQTLIAQGRKINAKSQRERDYLEAVATYFEDWAGRPERVRQQERAKAYEALAARYPDDDEAQIFFALYLAGTQSQSDQTYAAYLRSAAILEKQFAKYPNHPGVAHYLIHSYDAPPIARQGLNAARRYAEIAPAAPHALHMPSHIFTRVGFWEDAAVTNARSADAARSGGEPDGVYHASDYMVYAYLQLARDREAQRAMGDAMKTTRDSPAQTIPYAATAMPARYALERGAWREAAQLQVQTSKFAFIDAMTHFARALGAARSGDAASAEKDAEQLAMLHRKLLTEKNTYWAGEVEVQRFTAAAWIALAKGSNDEALKLMRAAADNEDRTEKHIVSPGRLVPARELLGEMLLELKQPGLALKEFEASQVREPNRFRGYYGAARAAEAIGERGKAADYYGKLLTLAKNADSARPELAQARSYVGQR